jgi:hypothetical protein
VENLIDRNHLNSNNKRLINPLMPQIVYKIFNNSVRTSKKTPHFTLIKIKWLMLFKEINAVCSEKYNKPITQNAELPVIKAGGIYIYH